MAFTTKGTRLAAVEEVTEGTPVSPTAGSDYLSLRTDFDVDPAIEALVNESIRGSIGQAKTISGLESPTASIGGYIKHSGVEGTAPEADLLYKSIFGSVATRSTERDTVGGSTAGDSTTAATVVVDAGEGTEFQRGDLLLIKDGANGYSMRPVQSVSTDTLTLGFNLSSAPASGVNLGRNTAYRPADTGHPTFTAWLYKGNGAVAEMIAGSRVNELTATFEAGQLVTSDFSAEGIEYYYNPVEVTSNDVSLDFTDDQGTAVATVTAKFYKTPKELAAALETALNAASTETYTVTHSDSNGKYTIATSTSAVLSLLWNTGSNTATTIGDVIGFSTAADDTGATSYESDDAQTLSSPQTPALDSSDPLAAKSNEVFLGDFDDSVCFSTESVELTLTNEKADVLDICATSGKSGTVVTGRSVEISMVAELTQHESDKVDRFLNNKDTKFLYNFGTKTGGNWDAGKCGCIYLPTCTISGFKSGSRDDLVTWELTITAFVDSSGNGEVYLNFV